jgi:purine catabolism regulator
MFPTVREVVALDSVRVGEPRLVAGESGLDQRVRWVHSAEVPDIASLLRGGELVLTTGIGLPADDEGIRSFIRELAEAGVVGLVVELGRRYTGSVPKVMVAAAQKAGLPLIELRRSTPFVPITQAVHSMIVDTQLSELRAAEEIHQRFTDLSVEGADPAEVVHQAAELTGSPVVLENLARQVLAYDAAGERASLVLDGWEQHSRRIPAPARTGYDADSGWLSTMVGARGQDWGRLLLRYGGPDPEPPTRLVMVLERAATTLALGRLIQRDAEGLARQLHGTLLSALLEHSLPVDEVALRARALGVILERRKLTGVAIRPKAEAPQELVALAEAAERAIRESGLDGLVSPIDDRAVGALIAMRPGTSLDDFASALKKLTKQQLIVAAGSDVDSLREARRSLVEARQVAEAARRDPDSAVTVHRLPHVGLAGLLFLLRDEPRLQTFVERQLGALLTHDARNPKEQLLPALRVYLDHGRNKSAAANAAHLSRPAFYERLSRIEKVLSVDLEGVPTCLSLHVALLALDALRNQ